MVLDFVPVAVLDELGAVDVAVVVVVLVSVLILKMLPPIDAPRPARVRKVVT